MEQLNYRFLLARRNRLYAERGKGEMKPRGVWFSAERIRGSLSFVVALLILFLLYFGTGRLGLSLGAVSGFATLVRFPSGLAITALLLFGFRLWPAIFLGALLL